MIRLVLLGLPGSGKSTQSAMLGNHYAVPVVSAGAFLRDAVKQASDIGRQVQESLQRGELAPNHLVDLLVFGKLRQLDSGRGFVLDGFPRALEQARSLDEFGEICYACNTPLRNRRGRSSNARPVGSILR